MVMLFMFLLLLLLPLLLPRSAASTTHHACRRCACASLLLHYSGATAARVAAAAAVCHRACPSHLSITVSIPPSPTQVMPLCKSRGYAFQMEIAVRAKRMGYTIEEVSSDLLQVVFAANASLGLHSRQAHGVPG